MGSIQDITEIKLSNLERKDWEARYKLIAASASQVVYDYNLKPEKFNGVVRFRKCWGAISRK